MRKVGLMFGPVLLAGLVLAAAAISDRGADSEFVLDQREARSLEAPAIEAAVRAAPEPRPDDRGQPGLSATCEPGARTSPRRNPWRCRVRYRGGVVVRYTVRVAPDGGFRGTNRKGDRIVFGRLTLPST